MRDLLARCPSGRASDSGARGRVFDTYLRRVVSLSKDTFTPRKELVIPRKWWLRPDMTDFFYCDAQPKQSQTFLRRVMKKKTSFLDICINAKNSGAG